MDDFDINDAFDTIILSENRLVEKGYEEGFVAGSREGEEEGYRLGAQKGSEIGQEVGFYIGFTEGWLQELAGREKRPEKIIRHLEKLRSLLLEFPEDNLKDVDIGEQLRGIRAKFKTVCAMLKINSDSGSTVISW